VLFIARQNPCRQGKNFRPPADAFEKVRSFAKSSSPSREFFVVVQRILLDRTGKQQGILPQDKINPSIAMAPLPRLILASRGRESIPASVSHALSDHRRRLARAAPAYSMTPSGQPRGE
jgi:hypothetical protein